MENPNGKKCKKSKREGELQRNEGRKGNDEERRKMEQGSGRAFADEGQKVIIRDAITHEWLKTRIIQ